MIDSRPSPSPWRAMIVLAVLACLVLSCKARVWTPAEIKTAGGLGTSELLSEADAAFRQGNFPKSELFYLRLSERPDLPLTERGPVMERLARSAFGAGHLHQARLALDGWAQMSPGSKDGADWNLLRLKTLDGLDSFEAVDRHLSWMLTKQGLSRQALDSAALWYLAESGRRDRSDLGLSFLAAAWATAPGIEARASLEALAYGRLSAMADREVLALSEAVTSKNQRDFPFNLVLFERARRRAEGRSNWSGAWRTMRDVVAGAGLVETANLRRALDDLERRFGVPRVGLALALPLTGRYQAVGRKILRGAGAAQWLLSGTGKDVDIKVVNTDVPGWTGRIERLPGHYSVVGGPLRVEAFREIEARLLSGRAFFAFLPELGEVEEGRRAWRFFSSPRDQVRALLGLALDRLGIDRLAVLYPDEKFGLRMGRLFADEARNRGAVVSASESYPPGKHTEWGRSIAKILDVPPDFQDNKEAPLPSPRFGAVFLPDGWFQAQLLVSNFFFYEADQLLLMGTELWSRSLDRSQDLDSQYFRLAVCPGAWWPGSPGAAELQETLTSEGLGGADFWVALGFDFVRFAAGLGVLPAAWTPDMVNERIRAAQDMRFGMAPLTWDAFGRASQDLYLFSPARGGKFLAEPSALAAGIEAAKERRQRRQETYRRRMDQEKAAKALVRPATND
ncbi:MAG: penicillin-binding protein activator [Desulfovibrionaceae bacterium]|nr:penicillin-binding protein activator [Desulfovibrionaceae bacterium]